LTRPFVYAIRGYEQAARLEILLVQLNAVLNAQASDAIKLEIIREHVARASK
jgi:hypothetical protein